MVLRVRGEIRAGKLEKRGGGLKPFFLKMDKGPCELDQAFIEGVVVRLP
jgi:hypothetical protein